MTTYEKVKKAVIKALDPNWIDGENAPSREVYEILAEGADISLAQVLRAIDTPIKINNLGGFGILVQGEKWEDIGLPRWTLSQPLSGQSEETLVFLASILNA